MKEISGYEGLYSIDEDGNVFGHKRNSFLKAAKNKRGYLHLSLCKKNKMRNFDVHRLVAITYIPNIHNKPQVNHISGIKIDNSVKNLEWCTSKENVDHSFSIGTRNVPSGDKHCCFGKPAHNRKKIINISTGEVFESISDAANKLNILRTCVRDCVSGRQKTAGGFKFMLV